MSAASTATSTRGAPMARPSRISCSQRKDIRDVELSDLEGYDARSERRRLKKAPVLSWRMRQNRP